MRFSQAWQQELFPQPPVDPNIGNPPLNINFWQD
jgi:hypothetical protein